MNKFNELIEIDRQQLRINKNIINDIPKNVILIYKNSM